MKTGVDPSGMWTLDSICNAFKVIDEVSQTHPILSASTFEILLQKIPQLAELAENAPPEIEEILAVAKDISNNVQVTKFRNIIIDSCFSNFEVQFLLNAELPKDGHDIKEDFLDFACDLAQAMKISDLKSIGPANMAIWQKFFVSNNDKMKNGLIACPLLKEGNSYKFPNDMLINYFAVRGDYEKMNKYKF